MITAERIWVFDRFKYERRVDVLAILVVVSLPWSTSVTSVLVAIWLLALLPTLDLASIRRVVKTPAGGLPVLLFVLAAVGMMWADVSWSERLHGLEAYLKLLAIPLLLVEFRRGERAVWLVYGLLATSTLLLVLAGLHFTFENVHALSGNQRGVPVKDYISQSGFFTLSAFILFDLAIDAWRARRVVLMSACVILAVAFLGDMLAIVSSRTTFIVIPVLALLLGWRRAGWKGVVGVCLIAVVIASASWAALPNLRNRVLGTFTEIEVPRTAEGPTSTALHLEFLRNSLTVIETAPVIGHGTGSIRTMMEWVAAQKQDTLDHGASNPHNQVFAVAIQLGTLGAAVLIAFWLAHLLLFRGSGLIAWAGLAAVVQNIMSSLVNSHLFDFTPGWLYVFAVGACGGVMLTQRQAPDKASASVQLRKV